MPAKTALPIVAALSVIGAASGLWLGQATVGDINPVYFNEAPTSFVAERVAYRSPDWAGVQLGEYQQQGLLDGIAPAPQANPVHAAPPVTAYGDSWAADAQQQSKPVRVIAYRPPAETIAVEEVDEAPADPDLVRVHRYSSYPVSREEADAMESGGQDPDVYAAAFEGPAE